MQQLSLPWYREQVEGQEDHVNRGCLQGKGHAPADGDMVVFGVVCGSVGLVSVNAGLLSSSLMGKVTHSILCGSVAWSIMLEFVVL